MIVRAFDNCGDISTRGSQYARDVMAIETMVHTRLRLFYGEYFRNNTEGTPWWQDILGKQPSKSRGEQLLRARIAQTPGVTQILEFNVTYEDREMIVQCTFDTIYGEGSIEHGANN